MNPSDLEAIPIFEGLSADELAWLDANSTEETLANGDFFIQEGDEETRFYVVLEGELQVTRTLAGKKTVVGTTPRGIIGGELALLNETPSSVTAQAIMPSRLLVLGANTFRALFAFCPKLGARVLQIAAERTQNIAGLVKQQEKMAALGKLSAGLAHELNNPAAAARRAAGTLREALPALQEQTVLLNSLGLTEDQLCALHDFQQRAAKQAATAPALAPLEQSDREEALGDWLQEHGVDNGWELAPALVSAQLAPDDLEQLLQPLPPQAAPPVLAWLNQGLGAASLLDQIEQSTQRIAELVGAVKSYTFMDQGGMQEVDLHAGLDSTLAMLNHKLKGVKVVREYDPELPRVLASGSELNQVWTNLIDNAIDALGGKGTLRLITRCENSFAMVEVADDGPGIPEDVLPRIFEPFYTTKDVGVGSGLGLDITYRIIRQHNGTVEVQSHPGLTRFIVRLPAPAG